MAAKNIHNEGIINALIFIFAVIVLVLKTSGVLTVPGIIAGLLAIYFCLTGRYFYAALIGVSTSTGSFIAQYITVYCSGCTLAAAIFGVAGLVSLMLSGTDKPVYSLSVIAVMVIGVMFMINNLPQYHQTPVIAQPVAIERQTTKAENQKIKKPILYITPDCKSCKEVVKQFIAADPKGDNWQPVVIPAILLARGESLLRSDGYKGEVLSAPESPTGFVPLLQIGEKIYRGKEINISKIGKGAGQ